MLFDRTARFPDSRLVRLSSATFVRPTQGTDITDTISQYSTTVTYWASITIEFGEKRKIRASTPFKVIQGHRDIFLLAY